MRFPRSGRKSRLGAVLSALRRMLVLGVLIFIALKANAPKRLLELYQTWSSPSAQSAGGGETSGVEPPSVDAASDDQTENVAAETGGTSVATSGDAGVGDVPDAQGLVLMDETDISDQDSSDTGAVRSVAGTDPEARGTVAPPSGADLQALDLDVDPQEIPPSDIDEGLAAHQDVAEPLQTRADDSAVQSVGSDGASGGEDTGDILETMMKEGNAVVGDGTAECPEGFPIKGNGRSGLYHVPEGLAYPRTKPDVCFKTPEAAERAGFRRATG